MNSSLLGPASVSLYSFLNDVRCDWSTTVVERWFPLQRHRIFRRSFALRTSGRVRLV